MINNHLYGKEFNMSLSKKTDSAPIINNKQLIQDQVCKILINNFGMNGVDSGLICKYDLIDDLALDSITFITLLVSIENHFDIVFDDDFILMEHFRNVDSIVDIITRHMSPKNR